jgi:anti-sigma factor RsiW
MNCAGFEKLIALHVEGDLPKRKGRAVAEHLKICEPCREFAEKLKASQALLKSLSQESVDDAVLEELRERILNRLGTATERQRFPVWRYAVGAALIVLVVLAAITVRRPSKNRVAEIPRVTSQPLATVAVGQAPALPRSSFARAAKGKRAVHRREYFQAPLTASAKPRQSAQLTVKLVTDNPNVVIYWLTD